MKQLRDFRNGGAPRARSCHPSQELAEGDLSHRLRPISRQDLAGAAGVRESRRWRPKGISRCTACHQPDFQGRAYRAACGYSG